MANITIKGIPDTLISKINCLVKETKSQNRSVFLINALNEYCLNHDNYYLYSLPDVTKTLVEDTLKNNNINLSKQLDYTLTINKKCQETLQDIYKLLAQE